MAQKTGHAAGFFMSLSFCDGSEATVAVFRQAMGKSKLEHYTLHLLSTKAFAER